MRNWTGVPNNPLGECLVPTIYFFFFLIDWLIDTYHYRAEFGIKNTLYSWDKLCVTLLIEVKEVAKWEDDYLLWMNIQPLSDLFQYFLK